MFLKGHGPEGSNYRQGHGTSPGNARNSSLWVSNTSPFTFSNQLFLKVKDGVNRVVMSVLSGSRYWRRVKRASTSKDSRVLYKGLNGWVHVPGDSFGIPLRHEREQHSRQPNMSPLQPTTKRSKPEPETFDNRSVRCATIEVTWRGSVRGILTRLLSFSCSRLARL